MIKYIKPIWTMVYFNWLIKMFHHCYNFLQNFVPDMNIILYVPKIVDYLKILTDEELKDLVAISFSEYFKSTVENCFLNEVKNKILVKLLNCICLTALEEVEKFAKIKQSNSPDKYVHRYNIELWIFLIQNYNWFTLKLWLKTNLKNCYVSWKSSDSISLKV